MSAMPSPMRNRDSRARRRLLGDEPIEMRRRRFGYFPDLFVHRGHLYQVYAVERCWTVARPRRGRHLARHYFRVRCPEGTFDLYQDSEHNTWHLLQKVA